MRLTCSGLADRSAHPVPAHHPKHIPALFFPADNDYALPPWMSAGMERNFPGGLEVVPLNTTHWAMTDINAVRMPRRDLANDGSATASPRRCSRSISSTSRAPSCERNASVH